MKDRAAVHAGCTERQTHGYCTDGVALMMCKSDIIALMMSWKDRCNEYVCIYI